MLKLLKITASVLLLVLFIALVWGSRQTQSKAIYTNKAAVLAPQVVLVELFTSQGCSSCPPADHLLQTLTAEAVTKGLPLITLSYHVDYWNRLGWKDPYSQAAFSERQRQYARVLPDQRVYTPQMIIQGQSGHVGSREREVRSAIEKQLQEQAQTMVSARLGEGTNKPKLREISYELRGRTTNIILQIAVIDTQLANEVLQGENSGRQLSHTNVVRSLSSKNNPPAEGKITINTNALANPNQGKVVLFVQDATQLSVLGATEISLGKP